MIKRFEEFNIEKGVDIKKDNKQKMLSNDVELFKNLDLTKYENIGDDPITIIGIQDVSLSDPTDNLEEAIIINADLGGNEVKRGDFIWITALVKKNHYNISSMAVFKVRIVDVFQSLTILNSVIKQK